jgi:hypothetical protein
MFQATANRGMFFHGSSNEGGDITKPDWIKAIRPLFGQRGKPRGRCTLGFHHPSFFCPAALGTGAISTRRFFDREDSSWLGTTG